MIEKRRFVLTRADLAAAVTSEFNVTRPQASEIIETILEEMGASLVRNEVVKIPGFGTFATRSKVARPGRNPKTGESVVVTARRSITFRASNILKESIEQKTPPKSRKKKRA